MVLKIVPLLEITGLASYSLTIIMQKAVHR